MRHRFGNASLCFSGVAVNPKILRLVMRRCQAFAALGAAPFEHQPAVLGRHARAESVRLGAAAIVGLKGSLRHSQEFSTSTKTPSLNGRGSDVKASGNRA